MPDTDNPYAAPQTELRSLSNARTSTTAAQINYLRQGSIAGLQMGGFGALLTILIYVLTWGQGSTVLALVLIPGVILIGCTLVGILVGLAVQLFALLFGFAPSDSLLAALPETSLEPPKLSANQEWDKTGHHPPLN